MTPARSAFVVLALFLAVAGFSLSVGVTAIPALPRFRLVRRQLVWLASFSLAAGIALAALAART